MHPIKDETMVVVDGCFEIEIKDKDTRNVYSWTLNPGDQIRIKPGTWHRINIIDKDNLWALREISTTHCNSDVERVDSWDNTWE